MQEAFGRRIVVQFVDKAERPRDRIVYFRRFSSDLDVSRNHDGEVLRGPYSRWY